MTVTTKPCPDCGGDGQTLVATRTGHCRGDGGPYYPEEVWDECLNPDCEDGVVPDDEEWTEEPEAEPGVGPGAPPLVALRARIVRFFREAAIWNEVNRRKPVPKRNHRPCSYCGGPMLELPPREDDEGNVTDTLRWKRCGACGRHQEGEFAPGRAP